MHRPSTSAAPCIRCGHADSRSGTANRHRVDPCRPGRAQPMRH